jgi:hypothetical protein
MTLDDFLPLLLVDVPDVPDVSAKRAILDSAIEFCGETNAWHEVQDPFTLIDNQDIYDIEAPTDGAVARVMALWGPTRPIVPKSMAQISHLIPGWQSATSSLPLYFNSAPASSQVRVFPKPLQANRAQLTPRVAYKPAMFASTLDDALVADYYEAICLGARARLHAQVGKLWSSPQMATALAQAFTAKIIDTRIAMTFDRAPAQLSIEPARPFGM